MDDQRLAPSKVTSETPYTLLADMHLDMHKWPQTSDMRAYQRIKNDKC